MTNKTERIALVGIATIMLVGGTTVSLAPMNVVASSGSAGGDDREGALRLSVTKDGETKAQIESSPNSDKAKKEHEITKESSKRDDNSDDPALELNKVERTITPDGETVTEEQRFSSGESSNSEYVQNNMIVDTIDVGLDADFR